MNVKSSYSIHTLRLGTSLSDEEFEGSESDIEVSSIHGPISDQDSSEPWNSESSDDESPSPSLASSVDVETKNKPEVNPMVKKIRIESSVRKTIIGSKGPLLHYFKQCSHEEYHDNLVRDQIRFEDEKPSAAQEATATEH